MARPGDKGEVSKMWQQLKTDIETAMAKKPDKESGGQYKRFSVIRSQVGAWVFCINRWNDTRSYLSDLPPF